MNMEEFKKEIIEDEGVKHEIYLDHLGLPTMGVGHLITEWDEEYGKPVGTPVSEERVNNCLTQDIHVTIQECKKLYEDFDVLPVDAQHIIANMMFNMGRPRLSNFKKMKEAVDQRDWFEAAYEMTNSKWCQQVPNRAMRLIQRMKDIQT
jgi:lysozyme